MNSRADAAVAAWLGLFLFAVYLLSFSGRLYSQDSMSMFAVTESVVKRGDVDTDQLWTLFKARNEIAPDGESYAKYGYGTSLLQAPFYALATAVPVLGLVQTTLLASAVATAAAGSLVFLAARLLDFSPGAGLLVSLLFGLATPAWVYAKELWSEPFAQLTLFLAFYLMLHFRRDGSAGDAGLAGVVLGVAVATRQTNLILVPLYLWYGFGPPGRPPGRRAGLWGFALGLSLLLASVAWYDWARYGSPLATGYRADETFRNPLLLGLYGLLFSPGKGLFVYVPFLAALPWSMAVMWGRCRRELLLVLGLVAAYLLTYSAWYYWWGGTNWGPRFLVPSLPFLALAVAPAAALLTDPTARRRAATRAAGWLFGLLGLAGFGIALLGISVPALWYRLHMVSVSPNPEGDAIFLPWYSPLAGYWDMLQPQNLDFAWVRAVAGEVTVDWTVVVLLLGAVACCGLMLALSLTGQARPVWLLPVAAAVLAGCALFSLGRYQNDPSFGGSPGYRAVVETLRAQERPGDVLVLNNDVLAPFFFNENRSRMRWYGLSRDPGQWDGATQALLARLSGRYSRIWLATDDSTVGLPDHTQDWLDGSLRRESQVDFADGVHLVLYGPAARP